ncbi:ThuA domain-containing protein [Tamlana agarivorans]|uniref:ThuA domain-containing protein n=1 Tax=Pseudotamlana agarivorans TaxID=481183 RepID=A0ACC5U9A9_9FLAO|nr:ThuA domain-containing protein [Tamlana agarivorans]MBU2950917.1 ThuA domain-containing protein [Tamlana agarivorans]
MKKRFRSVLMCCVMCLCLVQGYSQTQQKAIEVLIVDGFSNHNWQQTTFLVKKILEESGLFHVSVSTSPATPEAEGWDDWNPEFSKYDVIIQNTNNYHNRALRWPRGVEENLEAYVKSGGGLYILHSANNAFTHWTAYDEMMGPGWREVDEGIAIQIDEHGEMLQIPSGEGKTTYHGKRNDEVVYILKDHPINKDFPKAWKTADLELYKYVRGSVKNVTVLSYATDEENNVNWPVEWTVNYGKGRVYNSTMGHIWKREVYPEGFRCIGFQTTLIRATEWLATGKVTSKIPANFPTETTTQLASESLN